jgi:DNA-binding Lrp family transcriptional regulator
MTVRAYVLVNAETGSTERVQRELKGKPGVRLADLVIGPHDIVVSVEAADLNAVGKLVLNEIHGIGGVVNTLTYPVLEPESDR